MIWKISILSHQIFLTTWCVNSPLVTPAGIQKWIQYRKRFKFIDRINGRAPDLFYVNWYEKQAKLTFQAIAFSVLLYKINNTIRCPCQFFKTVSLLLQLFLSTDFLFYSSSGKLPFVIIWKCSNLYRTLYPRTSSKMAVFAG